MLDQIYIFEIKSINPTKKIYELRIYVRLFYNKRSK